MRAERAAGYRPWEFYESDPELKATIDLIAQGHFSAEDRELFRPLVEALLYHDEYLLLADYRAYVDCQDEVARAWAEPEGWASISILNVARSGKFSSDRAIREYCAEIWKVSPMSIATSLPGGNA